MRLATPISVSGLLLGAVALAGCGSSSNGDSSTETAAAAAATATVTATASATAPAPQSTTAVADPSSIRENSPCDASQAGVEITGYRGAPLKCDGATWVPQY